MQLLETQTRRPTVDEPAAAPLVPPPTMATPSNIVPHLYSLSLVGPVLLGLSVGLQIAMTAILLYGPIHNAKPPEPLTIRSQILTSPERDLPLYVGAVALCLLLMGVETLLWRMAVIARPPEERQRFALLSAGRQALVAIAGLVLYLLVMSSRMPLISTATRATVSGLDALAFLACPIAAAFCCWFDLRGKSKCNLATDEHRWTQIDQIQKSNPKSAFICVHLCSSVAKFLLFAAVVVAVLYVPVSHWNDLAGSFYIHEGDLLHHWNFFGMGPALGYLHGGAFETDFYSQYGMGWPLLFALSSRAIALTYGHMIGLGIIYGCIYYVALYTTLNLFFRTSAWAAAAVLLAITWQMFTGQFDGNIMWQYPSSTLLRHPMDVWFFLALLLHLRTGRLGWAAMAGVACGLGIFFETETGGYLAVTFGFYCLLTAWPGRWRTASAFAAFVLLTLLPLTWIASRGTMLGLAFWSGWIEGLRLQAFSGLGLLPIAGVGDMALVFFVLFLIAYLLTIGVALVRRLHGIASSDGIFLACWSLYGLALLLIFVGRSHPYNLYHPAVPLAVVLTAWLYFAFRAGREYARRSSFPAVLAGVLLLLLVTSRDFAYYPNLVRQAMGKIPAPRPCLIPEPPDLALSPTQNTADLRAAADQMRRLAADGSDVVVLDFEDTLLYHASGVRPAFRYASLFQSINTQAELEQHGRELLQRRPRYIVMRYETDADPCPPLFIDVWKSFHALIVQHGRRIGSTGRFEFWEWER